MSTLTFTTKKIMGHKVGPASRFPAMALPVKYSVTTHLDEDDGLFINYGNRPDLLPYTMRNDYDGPLEELEFKSAVLENSHLRAEVVIDLGGRLWSIYDKDAQRDLLLNNKQFLPGNLAIRNAWFAGGVEWNIGRRGHDPQTVDTRFASELADEDGTPVLRIYEFSRDALTPFQLEFFLPEDSKFLFVRNRILNQTDEVQPMYWWSNIAVEERKGARVVVPTKETYANAYKNGSHALGKLAVPMGEGFDGTYPTNFPCAKDHFYKLPENARRFESCIYPDGYGLIQCSTRRLQGRKLFVWGQGAGGHHWQRRLMAPDTPDYIEMQGGLAHTQSECLPMPPKTAWEWLEAYGAIQVAPEKVHGDWDTAISTVKGYLDKALPEERLDEILERTRSAFALKNAPCKVAGSGWGALEALLRKRPIAAQLDFGEPGEEQADWKMLLEKGEMDDSEPYSFMVQDEWFELLKAAKPGWKVCYHLALNYYRRGDVERAEANLNKSLAFTQNAWNLHALAAFRKAAKRFNEAAPLYVRILQLRPNDVSLAKDCLRALLQMQEYQAMLDACRSLSADVLAHQLIIFLKAEAIAHLGELDTAEQMLLANSGLEVPDIQEGEISTSELYIYIQVERARRKGITLDPKTVQVPYVLDLRMS